jgi:hypothetical protein
MSYPNQIVHEILQLTAEIETKYPELYKNIEETPISICQTNQTNICSEDLLNYLETLKSQIQHHLETHKSLV